MLSILRLGAVFYCLRFQDALENVNLANARFIQLADINIGAMLPMTRPHLEPACYWLNPGYARFAELIAYAVERVNKERRLISNLTMGYVILDNCFRENMTSAQSITFLPQATCKANTHGLDSYDVVAAMVANTNIFTVASCSPLQTGRVPHFSILSSNDYLSQDKPYFMTLIPSQRLLFAIIGTLLQKYGWTYAIVITTQNHHRPAEIRDFVKRLDARGMCISVLWLHYPVDNKEVIHLVKKLNWVRGSSRVVLFLTQEENIASKLIFEVSLFLPAGELIWIITTSMSKLNKETTDVLMGSLTVEIKDFNVPEFDDWLVQRDVNKLHDPWYRSYWEKKFDCSFDMATCNASQIHDKNDFRQDMVFNYGGYIIDSVFMIASAVSRVLLSTDCNNVERSSARGCVTGPRLLKELKATRHRGYTGEVKMSSRGSSSDRHYVIKQMRPGSPVTIASINARTGQWHDIENPTWIYHGVSPGADHPTSICNHPCGPNEVSTDLFHGIPCCFRCSPCKKNEIKMEEGKTCYLCPVYTWPKNNTCQPITPKTMSIDTSMGLLLALLSVLCLLACLCIFIFFQYHRANHIIKTSSIQLSVFMLFAISVGYMSVLSFMIKPEDTRCKVTFLCWGISFPLIYGPLFVRTVWVYRIFQASKVSAKRPFLTGAKTQVFFCIIIVIVQSVFLVIPVLIPIQWSKLSMLSRAIPHVVLTCSWPQESVTYFLIANCPLMVGSALLAFKTRHLPTTFNESHFIMVCVCTTLLVFVSYIPTYQSTIYELTKVQVLAVILILNHSVAVAFLFLPKIHAVLYRKNLQQSSKHTHTSGWLSVFRSKVSGSSNTLSNTDEVFVQKSVSLGAHSVICPSTDQRPKNKEAVLATSVSSAKKHDPAKTGHETEEVQPDTSPEIVNDNSVHVLDKLDPARTGHETKEAVQSDTGPETVHATSVRDTSSLANKHDPADTQHETEEAVQSGTSPETVHATSVRDTSSLANKHDPADTQHETEEAVQSGTNPETDHATCVDVDNKHDPSKRSSIQPSLSPTSQCTSGQPPMNNVPFADENQLSETTGFLGSVTGMFRRKYLKS